MKFKLTPDKFVELVVIALHWTNQTQGKMRGNIIPNDGSSFTVELILRVFQELELITEDEIRKLILHQNEGETYRRKLARYIGYISSDKRGEDRFTQLYVTKRGQKIISTLHLVKNKFIILSNKGEELAPEYEKDFAQFGITKDKYLAKVAELNLEFEAEEPLLIKFKKQLRG